ncbi:MAG: substrate-binding domain-containing protein [Anaerolineae bacterium]
MARVAPGLSGRQGRRPTLGVLAGWQYYWTATPLSYLGPLLQAIREAAQHFGCNLLLGCGIGSSAAFASPFRPAWPVPSADSDFVPIGPWNTDGLIILNPLHSIERAHYIQEVMATGHPVVFIAAGQPGPTVVADNVGGILQAMDHLVQHGHRRIAFIAGSEDDMEGDTGARLKAYRDALGLYGLPADERLIVFGRHVYDGGYAAIRQLLADGVSFSAVLASNDESAMGAMQALREAGVRIPQDVAIIGFDDRPESAVQQPPLSSVHVPLFELSYRGVEMLLRQIEGHPAPSEPLLIPTRLIPRASCGCGRNAIDPDAMAPAPSRLEGDAAAVQQQVAKAMAAAVLAEAQELSPAKAETQCRRLVAALVAGAQQEDYREFWQALETMLLQAVPLQKPAPHSGEDPHLWQAALSVLRGRLSDLLPPRTGALAAEWLDAARVAVSAAMWRRHRLHLLDERLTRDRVSMLTTRLLVALDEAQAYEILAQHLPEIGVRIAGLALFEAEAADPVAWSLLRRFVPPSGPPLLRFRSRQFPPPGFLSDEGNSVGAAEPFSLALVPLPGPDRQVGYMIFDTARLDLYGAIVQQLAAALNTAQLYQQATEGRRLAEEANRLKSRFLSMVSHELRTPLNMIVGLSEVLLRVQGQAEASLPASYRADVERILSHAQHLGRLINDVLDLASSEAGQLRLSQEAVDLSEALRMVAETGRRLATEKGLAWRETLPASGPWVWGDRTRLRQVALNLVHNAVKFTAQGEVRLELTVGPEGATVAVHDTGLGIPAEEQALIFDDFGRSERSIRYGYGGLGLGLAVCRRLVALHGGTIGVRSTGKEGEGSIFYFTLPTIAPPVRAWETAFRPQAGKGVLLLTGAPERANSLAESLRRRGIAVEVLAPVFDWAEKAAAFSPGAIVADVSLVAEQGWQMMARLRNNPVIREVPLLLYAQAGEGATAFELNHLTKPLTYEELTSVLDRHLAIPAHAAAGQVAGAQAGVHTVLVVDDDPDTVEMHARLVQTHLRACRVLKAHGGRAALEILGRERPDLVLLDLLMPDVDGFAMLEAMREIPSTRHVPVVILTGQGLSESDMARLNRGVATVLRKGLFILDETVAHIQAALERKRKVSDEAQRLVRKAMAYLHQHYADPISRRDIARHVGMDEDYLTACFRNELGVTPIAYLNRYRINQARRLLSETDRSITEIALVVGFSDSGYFSRVFRRETGCSPEAYRRAGRAFPEKSIRTTFFCKPGRRQTDKMRAPLRALSKPTGLSCPGEGKMALTLEEVAKLVGVSRSTVSRVINDLPGVRPAVRERVWQVIHQRGYEPNLAARALASRRAALVPLRDPTKS